MDIINEIETTTSEPPSPDSKQRPPLAINVWILRIVVAGLLIVISGLLYYRSRVMYRRLEASYEELEAVYQKQTDILADLRSQKDRLEELNQAKEETIQTLEKENEKLRSKLKLLDSLKEMEDSLARLKQKNQELVLALEEAKAAKPVAQQPTTINKGFVVPDPKDLTSSEQATKIVRILKQKIIALEERKKHLQWQEQRGLQETSTASARRQRPSVKGNKGFLIRNGQSTYVITVSPKPASSSHPQIRVEFMD